VWAGGTLPADYGCCGTCSTPTQSYGWAYGDIGSTALLKTKSGGGKLGLKVASGVASGAAVTVQAAGGTAAIAAGMASAAGGMATIPVAGWIAGAVTAAAAATVALVGHIYHRKANMKQAIQMAKALGLPNPKSIPGYTTRALRWDQFKIKRKLRWKKSAYFRVKRRGRGKSRRGKRLRAQWLLLRAILIIQQRNARADMTEAIIRKRGKKMKAAALKKLQRESAAQEAEDIALTPPVAPEPAIPVEALYAAGGVTVLLVGAYALKKRSA